MKVELVSDLTDREILIAIYSRLAVLETQVSIFRWIFGGVVGGGVAWLSWLTVSLAVLR